MSRSRVRFLAVSDVLVIHEAQLRRFGGPAGVLSQSALESAVTAPITRSHYVPQADLLELAAAYVYHLCQAHAFADGNKRVAFLAALTFLSANGVSADTAQADRLADVARGHSSQEQTAIAVRHVFTP